jgi:hypothetical protein
VKLGRYRRPKAAYFLHIDLIQRHQYYEKLVTLRRGREKEKLRILYGRMNIEFETC